MGREEAANQFCVFCLNTMGDVATLNVLFWHTGSLLERTFRMNKYTLIPILLLSTLLAFGCTGVRTGTGELCGNGFCGSGEDVSNCPGDCGGGGGGGGSSGGGSSGGNSSGGGSSGGGSSGGGSSGGGSAPAAPVFPDPGDGQTNVQLQMDALGERSRIELDWWAPATATGYVVEISRSASFSGSSTERWGTSSSDLTFIILSPEHRYGTKYYWRVEAYNDTGSTLGPVWSFRTESGSSGGGSSGGGGASDECGDNPFFADDRVQADAGPNLTIDPGVCISLNGSATEGHPPFTVAWTSPGMSFPSGETRVIACPTATGTFTFTVLDSCGVQDMDSMTITVRDVGGGGGSSGSRQSNFGPGTYHGFVVQETEIYSDGVLVDSQSVSSSQSITINEGGMLSYSVGDTITRWGLTTEVTNISVSDSGDIIRMYYDAYGTIDGVHMSGSGREFYTWLASSDSIMFSGSASVHTTNQDPRLEQDSSSYSTFGRL